jgi:hypothetical protein
MTPLLANTRLIPQPDRCSPHLMAPHPSLCCGFEYDADSDAILHPILDSVVVRFFGLPGREKYLQIKSMPSARACSLVSRPLLESIPSSVIRFCLL